MPNWRRAAADQLPLGLAHSPAMTRGDFLEGEANRAAIALVDRWPAWPSPLVYLAGPAGSGKSHLVAIWQAACDAVVVQASALAVAAVADLATRPGLAVEDVADGQFDPAALFHL